MNLVNQDTIVAERLEELVDEMSYDLDKDAKKFKEEDLILEDEKHRKMLLEIFKEVLKREAA